MGAGRSVADAIHYEIRREIPEQLTKRGHAAGFGNRGVVDMRKTLKISVSENAHLFRDHANARRINSLQMNNGENDLHSSYPSGQARCS